MRARDAQPTLPHHGADATAGASPGALARLRMFHTLDALRGVAAITVVLFHTAFVYRITPPAEGQIAVDLFFVMSGFIIAYRYEDDLLRDMSLAAFTKARLIRLYPLFLLGSVLGVVPALIAVLSGHGDGVHDGLVESFPLAVFMLPSRYALPRIEEIYPLNYVAWSLALEVAINILYAATIRYWTLRRLVLALALAFAGLCLCAARYGTLKYGYDWAQALVGVVRVAYGFTMGVVIYRLYRQGRRSVRVPWWTVLVAAVALFFFNPISGRAAWELVAVSVLVPAIVVAAIGNEPPKALQGVCAIAGIFSYVIYSLHSPFVGFFLRGEDRLHLDLHVQTTPEAFTFTGLLLGLCLVAHVAYDKPVRRMLTRWFAVRRRASIADPALSRQG